MLEQTVYTALTHNLNELKDVRVQTFSTIEDAEKAFFYLIDKEDWEQLVNHGFVNIDEYHTRYTLHKTQMWND